ncbi:hypothetical protein CCP3SC1AL1_1000007 [Gammaproteobacteria bacterium]
MKLKVSIRPIRDEDREQLWILSNDLEVRSQSFCTNPIPWEVHCRWFAKHRADPNWWAWVGMNEQNNPVGFVRFQIERNCAEVSVNVSKEARGQGIGKQLISKGCATLFSSTQVVEVAAKIKKDNFASISAFLASGFCKVPVDEEYFYFVLKVV